jgi:hypothetical protein
MDFIRHDFVIDVERHGIPERKQSWQWEVSMATVVYPCGCSFTLGMFATRELIEIFLCERHRSCPEVLDARLCDVQKIVMNDQESVE